MAICIIINDEGTKANLLVKIEAFLIEKLSIPFSSGL